MMDLSLAWKRTLVLAVAWGVAAHGVSLGVRRIDFFAVVVGGVAICAGAARGSVRRMAGQDYGHGAGGNSIQRRGRHFVRCGSWRRSWQF